VTAWATGAAAEVTADVAAVAAEVAVVVAEVTVEVTGAAADVRADVGKLAACACRDSPSRTARTPTAKITTCTARRAMCRNLGWGTASSHSYSVGTGQN
jgi:hypothetical protein